MDNGIKDARRVMLAVSIGGHDATSYVEPRGANAAETTLSARESERPTGSGAERNAADEKTLELNKRVESAADAMRLGASELRGKNKDKNKATLEFMGNPAVVAGVVIAVTGFGGFDGSWFVESCEHKVGGSGYTTSVEIRKTLKY